MTCDVTAYSPHPAMLLCPAIVITSPYVCTFSPGAPDARGRVLTAPSGLTLRPLAHVAWAAGPTWPAPRPLDPHQQGPWTQLGGSWPAAGRGGSWPGRRPPTLLRALSPPQQPRWGTQSAAAEEAARQPPARGAPAPGPQRPYLNKFDGDGISGQRSDGSSGRVPASPARAAPPSPPSPASPLRGVRPASRLSLPSSAPPSAPASPLRSQPPRRDSPDEVQTLGNKSPSASELRFINDVQEAEAAREEDAERYGEGRFITMRPATPASPVSPGTPAAASAGSPQLSARDEVSLGSAHSTRSRGAPSPSCLTPMRTLGSAPTITLMGSTISVEEEVKSVESAFSEASLVESSKSFSSVEDGKPNGDVALNGDTADKLSPIRKTPKKLTKPATKSLTSKFIKNKVQPIQNEQHELKSFDKPKEALVKSLAQLESSEWETVMSGLRSMERLVLHHPVFLETYLQAVARAVALQVRNLRSQVARAACSLAGNLFDVEKKAIEAEADELAVPLLHRTADTNKFLRIDANSALDKMCESIGVQKSIYILMMRGTVHQNAVVRCTSTRLLADIARNVGPEKIFNVQKELRDRLLLAGADLLTEGSLETRGHAKQLFRVLSQHYLFSRTMRELIPITKYRSIEKSLNNLKPQ